MSGSMYGLQGLGSNGLGMSAMGGGGGSVSPSLLAMLMSRLGGSTGTGGTAMAPTMPSAPTHMGNTPNPSVQAAPQVVQQQNTGMSSLGTQGLSSLLSALKGNQNGLSGLSATGQNTPISDMSQLLMGSPATVGIGQAMANTPMAGAGGASLPNVSSALMGSPATAGIGSALANAPVSALSGLSSNPGFLQQILSAIGNI